MLKFRGVNHAAHDPSGLPVVDEVASIDWMHDEVYFAHGADVPTSIADAKLMQATGVTDKHGIDIYEGDICSQVCSYGELTARYLGG